MATEPSAALVRLPAEPDHIMDTVGDVVGFTQYTSVSYWLGEAAHWICKCNPWEWAAQQFAGDWHLVLRASMALGNLATFNAGYAASIKSKADPLFADGWAGKAAAEADRYFDNLVQLLEKQVRPLEETSRAFEAATVGVMSAAGTIKGLLETLTDLLIALSIELAATAAAGWTVVGGIAGTALAAITASRAYQVWQAIKQVMDTAWNIVERTIGVVLGFLSPLRAIEVQPIPKSSYRATELAFEIPGG